MSINELPPSWLPIADAVVKATVILLAAALTSVILRKASAALRHLVWTLALFGALVLPVVSLALPKWQLPLLTIALEQSNPAIVTDGREFSAPHPTAHAPRLGHTGHEAAAATAPSVTVSRAAWLPETTWQTALFAIWLAGALAIVARIVVGLLAVRLVSRRTALVTDAAWLPMAMDMAEEMGITRRLRFLRSGRASMPVATGLFTPAVIMPADADTWSESRLRVVLLHELAHVKRRDCLTHVMAQAACAFYWFNPLTWLAVKRARAERERACDDLVLACGTRGSEYADQLLEMARVLRGDRFPALLGGASLAMAHRSQLEGRLIAILDPRVPRSGLTRRRTLAVAALACCAVAPLGALQPWATTAAEAAVTQASPVSPQTERADALTPPSTKPVEPKPTPAPIPRTAAAGSQREGAVAAHDVVMPEPQPLPHQMPAVEAHAMPMVAVSPTVVTTAVTEAVKHLDVVEPQEKGERSSRADPRTVAALTAALKDTDKEVRETAMQALVQIKDPVVFDPLVQALKDSSPDVREHAAFGLGQLRDKRAVQPLMSVLKDENADVREQVVFALGQLRDPAAVEGLTVAVRDANADVREQAVFALGQIRDRRAVEPLISALKDANADVREQAAFGLGQIRDRTAVDALVVAVKDTVPDVREQVVFALGQLRDPRAIDALTTALKDQNAQVRRQAAFALGQIAR